MQGDKPCLQPNFVDGEHHKPKCQMKIAVFKVKVTANIRILVICLDDIF